MTPAQYPEQRFRYSQRDPRWSKVRLGASRYTMATDGCLVTCAAYLISRYTGKALTPGALVDHFNKVGGLTSGGLMVWASFAAKTGGALHRTENRYDKTYTIRAVTFGKTVHFIVELRQGLCFDPWDGQIKPMTEQFRSRTWQDTSIRRYIKADRKPAT